MFCGFCERYGCEHYAKSSPQTVLLAALLADPRFEVRTECQVLRINVSADGKTATDVTYVDAAGRDASGTVGRNDAYQTMGAVQVFYDQDRHINPFMRSGASGTVIADFVGNNFDHGPLGYVGGAFIGETKSHGRPIEFHPVPPGTPALGLEWKLPWHGTTTTPWCSTCTAVPWRRAAMTWTWTRLSATPGACRCCA